MRQLFIAYFFMGLALCQPHKFSVCPTGCDSTTIQGGINALIAAQNANCRVGVLDIAVGTYNENPSVSGKTCTSLTVIRTRDFNIGNRRVGPSDASRMARIIAPSTGFAFEVQANNVLIKGLELTVPTGTANTYFAMVGIGVEVYNASTIRSKVYIDQNYMHGTPGEYRIRRGVFVACNDCEVTRNYIADNAEVGSDTQAVLGVLSRNLLIENNYLSAAGENYLTGGLGPGGGSRYYIPNIANTNIRLFGNYVPKDLQWKIISAPVNPVGLCYGTEYWINTATSNQFRCSGPGGSYNPFVGTILRPAVKNSIELKDGDLIAYGNYVADSFPGQQAGQGWFINQSGTTLYQTKKFDVRYNYNERINIIFSFRAYEDTVSLVSEPLRNVSFMHNAFRNTSPLGWNTQAINSSRWIALDKTQNFRFENNTIQADANTDGGFNIFSSIQATPLMPNFADKTMSIQRNIITNGSAVESYFIPPNGTYCSYVASSSFATPSTVSQLSNNVFFNAGLTLGGCVSNTSGSNIDTTNQVIPSVATVMNATTLVQQPAYLSFGANMTDVNLYTQYALTGSQKNKIFDQQMRGSIPTSNSIVGYAYIAGTSCAVSSSSGSASITQTFGNNIRWQVTGLSTKQNISVTISCSGAPTLSERYSTI